MDADKKPFDQWPKKKKVKYFAALKELMGDVKQDNNELVKNSQFSIEVAYNEKK